jgi:hypothetical protein
MHAAVATALDPRTDEPTVESAALIAYHWERAGAVWEAAQWQRRAARALTGSDTREAVARLRRVLELLGDAPESAAALRLVIQVHDDLLRFGRMGGITHEEGERLFAHARTLAERSGNRALLTRLLATFGESLFFAGGGADALGYLREANALARDVDDATVRLSVTMDNAQIAFWGGRLREELSPTAKRAFCSCNTATPARTRCRSGCGVKRSSSRSAASRCRSWDDDAEAPPSSNVQCASPMRTARSRHAASHASSVAWRRSAPAIPNTRFPGRMRRWSSPCAPAIRSLRTSRRPAWDRRTRCPDAQLKRLRSSRRLSMMPDGAPR